MARVVIYILLVESLICKVLSSYAQPTIQQYLQLAGVPHTIAVPTQHTAPATNQPRSSTGLPSFSALALPNLVASLQQSQTVPTSNVAASQPRPTAGLTSFSALGLPNLVATLQQLPATQQSTCLPANLPTSGVPSFVAPAVPNLVSSSQLSTHKSSEVKSANPSSIDSNLLNNLAIALQLLVVSNILNSPPPADSPVAKPGKEILTYSDPNSIPYSLPVMPNSNFVGTSSFAEPNFAQSYKPTRTSMSLMSPYEALSPNSPYSDPILSQYGSTNPRQDFQSPYSMIADTDLFAMNDLF